MIYIVKNGDSLSKITRDVLGDINLWPEIARINNISNANAIQPGQQITLPGPTAVNEKPDTSSGKWGILVLIVIVIASWYFFYFTKK